VDCEAPALARADKLFMENLGVFCSLVVVSLLWGITNPFIKAGSAGIDDVKGANPILAQIVFLATNYKFVVPFLFNQLGAIIFLFTLGNADLSIAIPFVHALVLVITALTGQFLNEQLNRGNAVLK
jgi:drug/metabolite transporter (DMT)-like permease